MFPGRVYVCLWSEPARSFLIRVMGKVRCVYTLITERTWTIWLLQSNLRSAVIVFSEPQITRYSLSKDWGSALEAERRCSLCAQMVGCRSISIIGVVSRVKFFLLTHFQMCKYVSIPHTGNVTIKRRRGNWRRIRTGGLATKFRVRAQTSLRQVE